MRFHIGDAAVKLAEAVSRLLDDAPAREKMGKLGAERLHAKLNWDRSVEQLLQAYATALERPGKPKVL